MARSNVLLKVFNTIFPFADFLYILQQEEYSSQRLIKWLPRFFFRRNFQVRDRLKYTKRVKLTLLAILGLWAGSFMGLVLLTQSSPGTLIIFAVWLVLVPFFVLVGNIIVSPYFERIKAQIRKAGAAKVAALPGLKIVTVAGSYGKTTTKNFIQQLVQYNYRTQMIPGNINTPAGIADWVNKNLESSTELLIAEVDAYEIGEIAKSCEVVPADIAVLTNIGDQHLERFGNEAVLGRALSEVFTNSKPDAKLLTTAETEVKLKDLNTDLGGREMILVKQRDGSIGLSESNQINLQFALNVAKLLNVPDRFTADILELPDRRQKLTKMYGYEAIDDSYNISFTTAKAGIAAARAMAAKAEKKLLVITAGIPELSPANKDKNFKLGELLGQNADHVVVLGSMFADEVSAGIGETKKYTRVKDLQTFLSSVKDDFLVNEWLLLMQPEFGDLYY